MKTPRWMALAVLIPLILFSSCKPDEDNDNLPDNSNPNSDYVNAIQGNYEWIRTEKNISGLGNSYTVIEYPENGKRYGMSIEASGRLNYFKNGTLLRTGEIVEVKPSSNGGFYIKTNEQSLNTLVVNDTEIFSDYFPNGYFNYLKKTGNTPDPETFQHLNPDCSGSYENVGSYTGFETVIATQSPFTDTLSHEEKTFRIGPGSPFACNTYLLSASGDSLRVFESSGSSTTSYTMTVDSNYMYVRKYINFQGYSIPKFLVYEFKGLKD